MTRKELKNKIKINQEKGFRKSGEILRISLPTCITEKHWRSNSYVQLALSVGAGILPMQCYLLFLLLKVKL